MIFNSGDGNMRILKGLKKALLVVNFYYVCVVSGGQWTCKTFMVWKRTKFFYRTQVSLGSGLWNPVSVCTSVQELWLRLCWCDSGWWWYQLNKIEDANLKRSLVFTPFYRTNAQSKNGNCSTYLPRKRYCRHWTERNNNSPWHFCGYSPLLPLFFFEILIWIFLDTPIVSPPPPSTPPPPTGNLLSSSSAPIQIMSQWRWSSLSLPRHWLLFVIMRKSLKSPGYPLSTLFWMAQRRNTWTCLREELLPNCLMKSGAHLQRYQFKSQLHTNHTYYLSRDSSSSGWPSWSCTWSLCRWRSTRGQTSSSRWWGESRRAPGTSPPRTSAGSSYPRSRFKLLDIY